MVRKRERRSMKDRPWGKLKPISVEAMLKAGLDPDCEDASYIFSEVCLAGYDRNTDLPLDFIIKKCGSTELVWLERYRFIGEDQSRMYAQLTKLFQRYLEEYRKEKVTEINVDTRLDEIMALLILLVELDVIKLRKVNDRLDNIDEGEKNVL